MHRDSHSFSSSGKVFFGLNKNDKKKVEWNELCLNALNDTEYLDYQCSFMAYVQDHASNCKNFK